VASVRIVSAGSILHAVEGEDLPPLKALAREATGASVRRVGRFVQLALVAAGRCVGGRRLPAQTGVYFASARGDLEVTVEVLLDLIADGRAPAPFTFINTVGNAVGFHVAACFGLSGRSLCATSRYAPLEAALRLALLDLSEGGVSVALVGSAEVCTLPLADHRERIGVPPTTRVGEASHWFLLASGEGEALGTLRCAVSFPGAPELVAFLREEAFDCDAAVLAAGQRLGPQAWDDVRIVTGIERTLDYRAGLPWYDSPTGQALHRFLATPDAATLVHVDGDPSGRCTLVVVDAVRPTAEDPTRPLPGRRTGR
jgi:hypothetical protein